MLSRFYVYFRFIFYYYSVVCLNIARICMWLPDCLVEHSHLHNYIFIYEFSLKTYAAIIICVKSSHCTIVSNKKKKNIFFLYFRLTFITSCISLQLKTRHVNKNNSKKLEKKDRLKPHQQITATFINFHCFRTFFSQLFNDFFKKFIIHSWSVVKGVIFLLFCV